MAAGDSNKRKRRSHAKSFRTCLRDALGAAAVLGLAASSLYAGDDGSILSKLKNIKTLSTTIPSNGDVNPYGLVRVPRTIGNLQEGHYLVSNFNATSNLQGTGTTVGRLPTMTQPLRRTARAVVSPYAARARPGQSVGIDLCEDGERATGRDIDDDATSGKFYKHERSSLTKGHSYLDRLAFALAALREPSLQAFAETLRSDPKAGLQVAGGGREGVIEFGGVGKIAHTELVEPFERARLTFTVD